MHKKIWEIYPILKNHLNLIIIAIPKRINKIPITISKIFKILFSPKSASGKEESELTLALPLEEDDVNDVESEELEPNVLGVFPREELVFEVVFKLLLGTVELVVLVLSAVLFKSISIAKLGTVKNNKIVSKSNTNFNFLIILKFLLKMMAHL